MVVVVRKHSMMVGFAELGWWILSVSKKELGLAVFFLLMNLKAPLSQHPLPKFGFEIQHKVALFHRAIMLMELRE